MYSTYIFERFNLKLACFNLQKLSTVSWLKQNISKLEESEILYNIFGRNPI